MQPNRLLEHPDVRVMRNRLEWMLCCGMIGGYSALRWEGGFVRYNFKIKQPIRTVVYLAIGKQ